MLRGKQCIECKRFCPIELFMRRWDQPEDEEVTVCVVCNVRKDMAAEKEKGRSSGEQFLKALEAADPVNSPDHYRTGGIECIDAMVQVFGIDAVRTYARINAFKYIWRHKYKGKPEEDLAKAAWYTRFADGEDPRKGGDQ